ncbi:MAG: ATP-dependent phosphofructokinase / diphosphate-dependent phosphofructokinase [Thermoplasmata archaeon]|jgi:6-phosphofructokinase 1|nr:ATP-dependent phosphofructokinase / diphosphate-dependent phosphofructokinase [Thermoplasmata archaeon]
MRIGVLNGGGPAPGLNGVINAVTLAARAKGWTVVGIPKGYSQLMKGSTDACRELTEADVSGIEVQGGSILFTSRANPTKRAEDMAKVADSVRKLKLDALVTIGGDDTATAAMKAAASIPGFRVAHVPKTIDNDLPLPGGAPTFGYETAKQLGAQLCRNLRVDARTTGRWYLVTAMGRSAGHLALGMAIGSGADLVVIPEEFPPGSIRLDAMARLVETAIAKRRAAGHDWGLVVLAEGLLDRLDPAELKATVGNLELDEHGNPRMSEVDLGRLVRDSLAPRLKAKGHETGFITKLIGYELRCADPCAFDVQYTRTLGSGAVEFLASGQGSALMALVDGQTVPLRFDDLKDPATGKVRIRRVDINGAYWKNALALQAR